MYKLLAGVLSIIIFAPVALFAKNTVAAGEPVDTIVAEAVEVQANANMEQALEAQVEAAPESPLEEDIVVQPQVVEAVIISEETDKGAQEPDDATFAAFEAFVQEVYTGQTDVIAGVFVSEEFTLDVVQQPSNNPGFISEVDGVVTDFALARDYGTIGMLAHNYLAGQRFDELTVGQEIYLVYGDNQFVTYSIVDVESYRALSPHSPYSDFVSLDGTEIQISATDLFYQVYGQEDALVLQTCIENDGNQSWGRLFITAVPNYSLADLAMVVDQP